MDNELSSIGGSAMADCIKGFGLSDTCIICFGESLAFGSNKNSENAKINNQCFCFHFGCRGFSCSGSTAIPRDSFGAIGLYQQWRWKFSLRVRVLFLIVEM